MDETTNSTTTSVESTSGTPFTTNEERQGTINDSYSGIKDSIVSTLQDNYTQHVAAQDADRANMEAFYDQQAQAVEDEYNRQNLINNQEYSDKHLNYGAGSQAELSAINAYQRNQNALNMSRQTQEAQSDLTDAKLNTVYSAAMAEAIANNDYQSAAALLDEYSNEYTNLKSQASKLAEYGDFSGYATLYGQEQADNMKQTWSMQNPLLAYNLGNISADEYHKLTGSYPPGYVVPGSGGGDWGGDSYIRDTYNQNAKALGWSAYTDDTSAMNKLVDYNNAMAAHYSK